METLKGFDQELKQADLIFSFYIAKDYHHFRLHPKTRNWFLFKVDKRYFRYITLPFGWKLSATYFVKLM